MTMGRRISTDLRRRRVLAYQTSRNSELDANPDRRAVEKLRQARRPATVYGSSVNRRLRGRWFSLVPVRRRAMAAVSLAILGTAMLLCAAHWLAVTWQPLAYREPLARPLRLDRPDSFGTWVRACLLIIAAGTSLLVYQLRRYRNDDYRGSYRLWPPVIILIALASLDCVCGLVPWCGELIDLLLGKRVAMAGSDWIRIGITVGGAALALRLVSEVRHSKFATVMMLLSIGCFATPLASRWGVLASDTPLKWWWITSAPLMAAATLCIACGAYLRKLFREVRRLDDEDRLSLRLRRWRTGWFTDSAIEAADPPKPRVTKRTEKVKSSQPASAPVEPAARKSSGASKTIEPRPHRKRFAWWFGRGPRKRVESPASAPAKQKPESSTEVPATAAPPIRANPAPKQAEAAEAVASPAEAAKRRLGLGSLFGRWRRSKQPAAANPDPPPNLKSQVAAPPAARQASTPSPPQLGDDQETTSNDDSSIDWASMGKAERRRLRRELKRSGDAA